MVALQKGAINNLLPSCVFNQDEDTDNIEDIGNIGTRENYAEISGNETDLFYLMLDCLINMNSYYKLIIIKSNEYKLQAKNKAEARPKE